MSKSVKQAPSYKKLSPTQLKKLGLPEKSERYYLDTGKRLTKAGIASRVISKRQHQKIQREGLTYTQYRREVESGKRVPYPKAPKKAIAAKRAGNILNRGKPFSQYGKNFIKYRLTRNESLEDSIKKLQEKHHKGRVVGIVQYKTDNKKDKIRITQHYKLEAPAAETAEMMEGDFDTLDDVGHGSAPDSTVEGHYIVVELN